MLLAVNSSTVSFEFAFIFSCQNFEFFFNFLSLLWLVFNYCDWFVQWVYLCLKAIRRKENGWYDEEHPLVFLFLGSSGIGRLLSFLSNLYICYFICEFLFDAVCLYASIWVNYLLIMLKWCVEIVYAIAFLCLNKIHMAFKGCGTNNAATSTSTQPPKQYWYW